MQSTTKHMTGACKRLRARRGPAQRCAYATSSTEAASATPSVLSDAGSSSSSASASSTPASSAAAPPNIRTAMLVHRAPLLTPTPHPLEAAYHAYSASLHAALANPAPTDFYFKKGSLLERRFVLAQWEAERERFGARLAGKRPDVGDIPGEEAVVLQHREPEGEGGGEGSGEADRTKLERRGDRSVYLVVREKGSDAWTLPSGPLEGSENLHESASRNLRDDLGADMDLWLVTRKPIAHYASSASGKQTFVFKSHILAGQAAPSAGGKGRIDAFAWLTREEAGELLRGSEAGGAQWAEIESVLSD